MNEYHIRNTITTPDGIIIHLARERRQITGRYSYFVDFDCLPAIMGVNGGTLNQAIRWHMPLRAAYGVAILPDNARIRLFKLSAIKELISCLGADVKHPHEALTICNKLENFIKEQEK